MLLLDASPAGAAGAALRRALRRRQAVRALQHAERIVLDTAHGPVEVRHGRMVLPDDAGRVENDAA